MGQIQIDYVEGVVAMIQHDGFFSVFPLIYYYVNYYYNCNCNCYAGKVVGNFGFFCERGFLLFLWFLD